jgi:hypothetical protein
MPELPAIIFGVPPTLFGAVHAIGADALSTLMTSKLLFYTVTVCRNAP